MTNNNHEFDQVLDTSGTRCPIPLIRAKQALKEMQRGQTLQVIATDPAAKGDFELMLSHLPHELVSVEVEESGRQTIVIRKG